MFSKHNLKLYLDVVTVLVCLKLFELQEFIFQKDRAF